VLYRYTHTHSYTHIKKLFPFILPMLNKILVIIYSYARVLLCTRFQSNLYRERDDDIILCVCRTKMRRRRHKNSTHEFSILINRSIKYIAFYIFMLTAFFSTCTPLLTKWGCVFVIHTHVHLVRIKHCIYLYLYT